MSFQTKWVNTLIRITNEIYDLMSLLKVFDVNFANGDECQKLQRLDVNNPLRNTLILLG